MRAIMTEILQIPPIYRWLITLAFVGLIVVLSVAPGRPQPGDSIFVWLVVHTPTPIQKLLHVACYAVIAGLWVWTLEPIESRPLKLTASLVLTIGLGGMLEWAQTQVPGRFGSIVDVLLNAAGAVAGLILAALLL